jgi:hypothetical protein
MRLEQRQVRRDKSRPASGEVMDRPDNGSIRLTPKQPDTIILTPQAPKPWWYDDRWISAAFGCGLGIFLGIGMVLSGPTTSPNFSTKILLLIAAAIVAIFVGDIPIRRKIKPDFELSNFWGLAGMLAMPFIVIRLLVAHPETCVDWSWNSVCKPVHQAAPSHARH